MANLPAAREVRKEMGTSHHAAANFIGRIEKVRGGGMSVGSILMGWGGEKSMVITID